MTAVSAMKAMQALVTLQQLIAESCQSGTQLHAGSSIRDLEAHLGTSAAAADASSQITDAYERLRVMVIAVDSAVLGSTIESFGELAIRAKMLIVSEQLSRLDEVIRAALAFGASQSTRAQTRFANRRAVRQRGRCAAVVQQEFSRAIELWAPHRAGHVSREHGSPYASALHAAQRVLVALLDDADLAALLRAGETSDWPDVQMISAIISMALLIRIPEEPTFSTVVGCLLTPATLHVPSERS
ncbi:MAG TPA: hypothetical protein VH165_32735 [Kofleriaceae bacterium]|nr:hypothetical protein [Kofleriaceae bacterium]